MKNEPIFAVCKWQDAWADGVDDATHENVRDKHRPLEMETRGWILLDDEIGISLFYERCLEPLSYRGRTFIPRAMIKSVEEFPPKRRPRKPKQADQS